MSDDDEFMGEGDVAEVNVPAAPKPEPAKPSKAAKKDDDPLPHENAPSVAIANPINPSKPVTTIHEQEVLPNEIAAAIGHDPIFALDIVIACANHEQNRRCPALANIVQSFAINRQEMVDWLDRVAQRTAERAARNEEAAK
jgi:hypothetical protein